MWNLYMSRSVQRLKEVVQLYRTGGGQSVMSFIRRTLFCHHSSLLFRGPSVLRTGTSPQRVIVKTFKSAQIMNQLYAVEKLCSTQKVATFASQGAALYVAYLDDSPVALGWMFPVSRPLLRIDPDGVLLGGFFVKEAVRGLGIYGCVINRMLSDLCVGKVAYAEASRDNYASQRGLLKAGFDCMGTFTFWVVFGFMVFVRCHPLGSEN